MDRQTDRQTDRQAGRQADTHTDRQTDTDTHRHFLGLHRYHRSTAGCSVVSTALRPKHGGRDLRRLRRRSVTEQVSGAGGEVDPQAGICFRCTQQTGACRQNAEQKEAAIYPGQRR